MKTNSFLVKNSRENTLSLILEPMAHIFDVVPGSVVEVYIEQQPDSEVIELECIEDSLIIYCGGIATVRSNGVELPPQFME